MDLFHKIIDLVDKNSSVIPEGDYIELCDTIKELREKVKPPPFLIDQNEPMSFLQRWIDVDDEEELAHPGLNAFLQDLHTEWSATDDGNSMNDIIEKFRDEFITDRTKHNLPEETYRKVYEFYTQLWSAQ
jgi:phage-related protein